MPRAGSAKGKALLADWANEVQKFWQLVPPSEANTPEASPIVEASAATSDAKQTAGARA